MTQSKGDTMKKAVCVLAAATAAVFALAAGRPACGAEANAIQGMYKGMGTAPTGEQAEVEADVVGEGVPKGQTQPAYRVIVRVLADDPPIVVETRGSESGGKVPLSVTYEGIEWKGAIAGGKIVLQGEGGGKAELARYTPHSPTEGAKPPQGALVLLGNPATLEHWTNKKWAVAGDTVEVRGGDSRSVEKFGDVKQLHVEFKVPYMPDKRGQERGNSGVYLADFYEVQVLDSFGLKPNTGDCGGLYSIAAPKVNASYPPETWQTYDITFRAARLDADGKLAEPASITVRHNGVLIHENLPLPRSTERSKPGGDPKVGPIRLQDHGYPDQFRNIWLVEK
jgi:hypothetical protein